MTLVQEILDIPNLNLGLRQDLTRFTTMRLKSTGDVVEVKTIESLQKLLPVLKKFDRSYIVVGWGANQIFATECRELLIHLDFEFNSIYGETFRDEYEFPASVGVNYLTSLAIKFGLSGWDVFTGIPASLGGAIFMNAGTNLGEIGPLIKSVKVVSPDGKLKEIMMSKDSFSYRKNHFLEDGEIIVSAVIVHKGVDPAIPNKIKNYLEYRKKSQPLASKNCGCVFKNPHKDLQAGRLIDLIGLKGLVIGGLKVSPKHANFIENIGSSDWDQFQDIISIIKSYMDSFYGIEFELEVKIPYHL